MICNAGPAALQNHRTQKMLMLMEVRAKELVVMRNLGWSWGILPLWYCVALLKVQEEVHGKYGNELYSIRLCFTY